MLRRYVLRGVAAGALAGVLAALVLLAIGEPPITEAIEFEETALDGHGHSHGHEPLFSRSVQVVGGALGTVLAGTAVGLIFAVVFAAVRHRLPGHDDRGKATALATTGFVAVYFVPWLKYPPNPPGVGDPDTVSQRTILYLLLIAWGVLAVTAAVRLFGYLRRRLDTHDAVPVAAVAFAGLIALALIALPANADPVAAPADLVWHFRLASLAGGATLWSALGVSLGWWPSLAAASRVAPARRRRELTAE